VDQRQAGKFDCGRPPTKQSAPQRGLRRCLPAEKGKWPSGLGTGTGGTWTRTFVRAGSLHGRVEQFALRRRAMSSIPLMRARPGFSSRRGAGQRVLQAGFGQIEAQIMKEGDGGGGDLHLQALGDHPHGPLPPFMELHRRRTVSRWGEAIGRKRKNVARPGSILVPSGAAPTKAVSKG